MPDDVRVPVFRFGVFEADAARGELRKHGVRIKLHAQPFQVLVMLLEKPSELVTREEMRLRLWGEDTFVDFDHGLNSAVNKIRDALDDSASQPRYVETVSGKGYRFIAPVSQGAVGKDEGAGSTQAAVPAVDTARGTVLATPEELPAASRKVVRILLLLVQTLYFGFYVGALANLREIGDIFFEERLPDPSLLLAVVVTTAALLIPVRLFLATAVAFNLRQLPSKFARMFPVLLVFDLLWAASPFLLVHHVSTGLALGMTATLVYLPFAQRSLVLMFARGR
ncbi:MAG TPA: winged helix-turn-helix domain-containing protein [Bryobacteraceae bacterium]|nr:winged helix-turn-helix domain-containing protein [Bryobacteraceae bacterium]